MKTKIKYISIIILFPLLNCFAQTDSVNVKTETGQKFKNAGSQQDYWAKQLFSEKYEKQIYEPFKGQFSQIDENTFRFDEKILEVYSTLEDIKQIIEKGIFYPNIITGNQVAEIKTKQELDLMNDNQKLFYFLTRIDSLRITDFEELKFLSNSPTIKRFRFALWNKADSKPTACFIELTNMNAKENTTFQEYLENALLTFYISAWRI